MNKKNIFILLVGFICMGLVFFLFGIKPKSEVRDPSLLPSKYTLVELVNASEFIKQSIDAGDNSCFGDVSLDSLIYVTQPLKSLIDDKNGYGNPVPPPTMTNHEELKKQFCSSELIQYLIREMNK